jgi:hypothetical protein
MPSLGRITAFEWATVGFWGIVVYKEFISRRRPRGVLALPGRFLRLCVVILTLGLLSSCANTDPLTVASGPVFQLNPGHWQPSKQALAAPPTIVAD